MKRLLFILYSTLLALCATAGPTGDGVITSRDITFTPSGGDLVVNLNLILDELKLGRNHQVFVTPFIENGDETRSVMLPTYVFSGRNMHYVYLRNGKTKASGKTRYNIAREMYAPKGNRETVDYTQRVPLEPWMLRDDATLRLSFDTCGCGRNIGASSLRQPLGLNPAETMSLVPFPKADASVRKPINHHGEARVQFEVNKVELHEDVYRYVNRLTKREHTIDNRAELQGINDSISYALADSNVEIESISICGFASPETQYDRNDYLATNRSRALSEYIARKYNLPIERCHYSAVPENWAGFRKQVETAADITEQQRKDLLALIDEPCYGPMDYDAKEHTLNSDVRFAKLYKEKILPDWFPELRVTQFNIRTQLKPLTPEQLRGVMAKTPELMSLDEIYLVANSYEHGSEGFLEAMKVALEQYPDDPLANANAAAVAIESKDYKTAESYLSKAGDTAESNVMRGIVATWKGHFDEAQQWFDKAGHGPEVQRNLQLLKSIQK